jgi:hypothetical protein
LSEHGSLLPKDQHDQDDEDDEADASAAIVVHGSLLSNLDAEPRELELDARGAVRLPVIVVAGLAVRVPLTVAVVVEPLV